MIGLVLRGERVNAIDIDMGEEGNGSRSMVLEVLCSLTCSLPGLGGGSPNRLDVNTVLAGGELTRLLGCAE